MAISVFTATPQLIRELAQINPLFYESDLIEVGRRLDYSRWINFIELASSTRWKEIKAQVTILLQQHRCQTGQEDSVGLLADRLNPTDRITGETMAIFSNWLTAIIAQQQSTHRTRHQELQELLQTIRRADSFTTAHAIVRQRLPLCTALHVDRLERYRFETTFPSPKSVLPTALEHLFGKLLQLQDTMGQQPTAEHNRLSVVSSGEPIDVGKTLRLSLNPAEHTISYGTIGVNGRLHSLNELAPLARLDACCRLFVALAREIHPEPPILLISAPQDRTVDISIDALTEHLDELAESCQCLCACSGVIPDNDIAELYR